MKKQMSSSNRSSGASQLKELTSMLPELSLAIIGLSLLKLFFYYSYFNVPIQYYLSISEVGIIERTTLILPSESIKKITLKER